jgi:PKD repeat protein
VYAPGNYVVSLTATNAKGSQIYSQNINTNAVLVDFTFNNSQDPSVDFTSVSANAISWEWDMGDGNKSFEKNTTHIYADSGCYDVTLTVEDITGCSGSITKQVCVKDPDFNYVIYPNPAQGQISIQFEGKLIKKYEIYDVLGQIVAYDDVNLRSGLIKVDLTFISHGMYLIKLVAEDDIIVRQIELH